MRQHKKAIVVGGGLSGLICALQLAEANVAVEIVEKSDQFGGRARSNGKSEFVINQGPRALYVEGHAHRILQQLGVATRGGTPRGNQCMLRGGRLFRLPSSPTSLMTTGGLSIKAKWELAGFMARLKRLDPKPWNSVSVDDWLATRFRTPDARGMMKMILRLVTYNNSPATTSAGAALSQLQLGGAGVLYLDNGWQSIIDQLCARADQLGVQRRAGGRVSAVETRNDSVSGVLFSDGTRMEADVVVLATTLDQARTLLPSSSVAAAPAINRPTTPVRAACLDVALSKLPRPKRWFVLGYDEPLYCSVHSRFARLGPPGSALIHAAVYLGPGESPEQVRPRLEALLDQVQPTWRKFVVHSRYLGNMEVASAVDEAAVGGTNGRPSPEIGSPSGLYVCGDWVGPEGMLADAAAASARQAARLAASYLQQQQQHQEPLHATA